jgi:hypothetical protein
LIESNLKLVVLFFLFVPMVRVDRMVMVVMMERAGGDVAAAFTGNGTHGLAGHGVVVRAADVHLDSGRLGAVGCTTS